NGTWGCDEADRHLCSEVPPPPPVPAVRLSLRSILVNTCNSVAEFPATLYTGSEPRHWQV
ncbi:hypothetical protein J6590_106098, partial [Homalodisca vitripennis]